MIKRSLVYGVWTGFFVCVIACLSVSLPSVCLSLGLFVCLSVCLSFSSLSISLSFSLSFFLSVCLSACKFICLSVFLYMSVWLFIYLSAYLFVWLLSVYLFVFLSVCLCLSLCLSISVLSVDRSVFLSVCLCTFIFVCMYVFLSVWLSLCFCFVFYSPRPCVCQPVHLTACLSAALLLNHTHFHTINVFFFDVHISIIQLALILALNTITTALREQMILMSVTRKINRSTMELLTRYSSNSVFLHFHFAPSLPPIAIKVIVTVIMTAL